MCVFPEPMGSVGPRVNKKDSFDFDTIAVGKSIAVLCPAQSYPVPIFR